MSGAGAGPEPLTGALPLMSSIFDMGEVSETGLFSMGRDEDAVDSAMVVESFAWDEDMSLVGRCRRLYR